jgi:hypothetical protein
MNNFRTQAARAATEFAVVVLGVAAALGAENWRESISEEETASGYLGRLHSELIGGRATIEAQLGWVEMATAAMDTLLSTDDLADTDIPMLVSASAAYGFVPSSVILDQTYLEMLSTGALSLVSDAAVRKEIAAYFRTAARFRDNLEGQERDGLNEWALRVQAEIGRAHRSVRGRPEDFDDDARTRAAALLQNPEWQSIVRRTRVGTGIVAYWLEQLLDQTDVLIQTLDVRESSD